MKHVKLLDCTLRDGAYLIDKDFGHNTILGIIEGLVKSKIDIIEIGFFQDEGFKDGRTVYKNSKDAKKYIPKNKNGTLFTVLADYSRYSIQNLDDYDKDSIDAIRECFFKHERYDAIKVCKEIKKKGYKVFLQPVDILGYTDYELLELIELANEIEPYCFSFVDTFGSMYQDDLHRLFEIIDHNLISTCKIGFHSHNNMQLSNALSQEFVRMTFGKRNVIIDGTISGMGRGAGNTPIELIAQYLVSKWNYSYDIDSLLDIMDDYMDNIRTKCTWGYSTPYFIAGSYGAHVNNIQYLTKKSSIRSKDIRYILNKIGNARKRYNYDLLEQTYLESLTSSIDDTASIKKLEKVMNNQNILIVAPGHTTVTELDNIKKYIKKKKPIVISISYVPNNIEIDYVYMNNLRRYSFWKNKEEFKEKKKILASNIKQEASDTKEIIVSFKKLVKCGWECLDNSTILLLRLLDEINVKSIAIAGFDGYQYSSSNYASENIELSNIYENTNKINVEIYNMLKDYMVSRKRKTPISFLTSSKFSSALNEFGDNND